MFAFSYRSFRNHLEGTLEKTEIRFLMRTFGYASIYFFLFGVLTFIAHLIINAVIGEAGYPTYSCMGVTGLIMCFPLHYFAIKYRNNPLRVPASFVHICFVILTFAFMFVFLGVTGILANLFSVSNSVFLGGSILAVLGVSVLIYMIPVVFAWVIRTKKIVIKLNKFLNTCYLIYLLVFVATVLALCLGFGISGAWRVVCLIIFSSLIFWGPVLTIYRLKTVAYYINHDDNYERRRWENYFAFEIAFQLLHIAYFVVKALIILIGRARTRLR